MDKIEITQEFADQHHFNDLHIKVMLFDNEKEAELTSCFLQCLKLSEWIATNPDSFCIHRKDGERIIYSGVQWGNVIHDDPDEMSACHARTKFTYLNKEILPCK